jgi:hypothetical protein
MKLINAVLIATFGLFLFACSGGTKVERYWEDENYQKGNISKVLVVALHNKTWGRKAFEFTMKKALEDRGIEAIASIEVMPEDKQIDKGTFEKYFANQNIDAVLTSRLISADEKTENVYNYTAYGIPYPSYYGGFYGFYMTTYSIVYSPGYTVSQLQVNLETNLYDTKDGKLVWGAVSETFEPEDALDFIRSASSEIARELDDEGFLKKK